MNDPVDIYRIANAALLGGAIIFCGASYALFLALSRLATTKSLQRVFHLTSIGSYLALAASVVGLTIVLNLWGWWLLISLSMLIGYFMAPRFVWRLSEAVHVDQLASPGTEDSTHA